ncbi:Thymidylate kinase [bioreactor metagenome]|uniref:dTMP kinase n=1 Tax=bioreactor metagenome TaxID=1076179 RepID=A0A644UCC0_9ZZZZ|nr:dTMP kinase [Acidaminococcaceae bacterium]NLU44858.1 dTMP kinase [Acholeplasmataceae bacterium]
MKKSLFITFEGPDGSGKTTQIERVAKWLEQLNYNIVCTREPGGTKSAEKIRQIVLDPCLPIKAEAETLLYLAARAEHVEKVIAPALLAGKIVLCDRFSDSTFVYQGITRGMDLKVLRLMDAFATKGLKPDVTFILDGLPELLVARRQKRGIQDRFELEGLDFQQKVRAGFMQLAQEEQERIKVINALQELDDVTMDIITQVKKLLLK